MHDEVPRPAEAKAVARATRVLLWVCFAYAALALGLSWLLTNADDMAFATLVAYAPRWPWLLPGVFLVPWTLWARRLRAVLLALGAVAWIAGPVMGLEVNWQGMPPWLREDGDPLADRKDIGSLRIVTCNTDNTALDAVALMRFLDEVNADVVVLQEANSATGVVLRKYPHVRRLDQYLVGSRYPLDAGVLLPQVPHAINPPAAHFEVTTPFGNVALFTVHFMSPRRGITSVRAGDGLAELAINMDARRREANALLREVSQVTTPLILAGDFNTTTAGAIYETYLSRYVNAFGRVGAGYGFTHFTKQSSLRIDHVLASYGFRPRACRVGPFVGSEHRPVVADLSWVLERPSPSHAGSPTASDAGGSPDASADAGPR